METARGFEDYTPLAWFYDTYWDNHEKIMPILDALVLPHLPEGARIFDLCCGTGHLARALAERGYTIIGVDSSEEMLAYARAKVPGGIFIASDARSFTLQTKISAAVSTLDGLNHILKIGDLARVFKNVLNVLEEGGHFLFDILTEEAYLTLWDRSSFIVKDDNVCIVQGGYQPEKMIGWTNVITFILNGGWHRSDATLFQRCYSVQQIISALKTAGFRKITPYDARTELGMSGNLAVGRKFFHVVK